MQRDTDYLWYPESGGRVSIDVHSSGSKARLGFDLRSPHERKLEQRRIKYAQLKEKKK